MPTTPNLPYEGMARRCLEGPHYAAAVMAMAKQKTVFAAEDIYTADGAKLVAAGTRIGDEIATHLFAHRLFKPIDLSLAVEDGVTAASLAEEALRMCVQDEHLRQLAARHRDMQLNHGLLRRFLLPQMAFKLTVAREQRPRLFRHLLMVALIGYFLALRRELPETDTVLLLAAALFHDLGELHTDPDLLAPGHRVGERERRYIYAHPIVGYLLVKDVAGIDDEVATAVLQHQERLDGSGYPLGLRAARIGPLARIVAVADVCAAILERFGNSGRLSTLMRLNRQKYDNDLLALLYDDFAARRLGSGDAARGATMAQLKATIDLLARWDRFRAALAHECGGTPPHALVFVFERMVNLRVRLLQSGFDPDSLRLLAEIAADDAQVAAEITAALDEVRWQFADLEHEIARRRETIAPVLSDRLNRFIDNWSRELRAYPDASNDAPASARFGIRNTGGQ